MTAAIPLAEWTVYETAHGTRHFVGRATHGKTWRYHVSEAIVHFDTETRTGIDQTGHAWMLSGASGGDCSTPGAWQGWCDRNDMKGFSELTERYRVTSH